MWLLIHTGGTIGMVRGPEGLLPGAGVLEAAVAGRARVLSFDPLLDSADVDFRHWNRLIDLIRAEQGPVVVTHGTDTMTWTGAALTQALAGWPHPVILTGAMHPLGTGGDAEGNLELALGAAPGPGVWLAFAGRVLPAGALVKSDSQRADAFRAVDQPVRGATPNDRLRHFPDLRIGVVTIHPGISAALLGDALAPYDRAVLRVFGTGTIPSSGAVAAVLRDAVGRGQRLRAVSSCENGGLVPGSYAAGRGLWAVPEAEGGVQDGGAETLEAAMIHLWLQD